MNYASGFKRSMTVRYVCHYIYYDTKTGHLTTGHTSMGFATECWKILSQKDVKIYF
jgi:hypothetical protein